MKSLRKGVIGGLILGAIYGVLSGWILGFSTSLIIGIIAVLIPLIFLLFSRDENQNSNSAFNLFVMAIVGTALGFYFTNFGTGSFHSESYGWALFFNWVILGLMFGLLIVFSFINSFFKRNRNNIEEGTIINSEVNKNNRVFLAIIFLVILLIGIWVFQFAGANECEKVSGQDGKDRCYMDVAKRNKNPQICESVVNLQAKNDCYNNLAQSLKDITLCTKIVDTINRSYNTLIYCYSYLVGYIDPNYKLCEQINNQKSKLECHAAQAIDREDKSICQLMDDKSKISDCENIVLSYQGIGDLPSCEKAEFPNDCYYSIATSVKDPTICDKISNYNHKFTCYGSIAIKKKDISICNGLDNASEIEKCKTYANV